MGCCASVDAVEEDSRKEFESLSKNKTITKDELRGWVGKKVELWSMINVNLGLSDDQCKDIATDVAFGLASEASKAKKSGKDEALLDADTLTRDQFHDFRKNFVVDPKGNLEFFHRCVFAAYDEDKNGVLDRDEVDVFLDIFYKQDSIFKGDHRLPSKEELKKIVYEKLDENKDGVLDFDEIRILISGKMQFPDKKKKRSSKIKSEK